MKPLSERIKREKNVLLERINKGSARAFRLQSARLNLIFSLLVAILVPIGVLIATAYVTSLMEELGYYSFTMYLIYYAMHAVCLVAMQLLLLGTAYSAVRLYSGQRTEARDVLYAFKGKAFVRNLAYSLVSSAFIAMCAVILFTITDAFDTLQKTVDLSGLGGGVSIWAPAALVVFGFCIIMLLILARLAPIPFLMVLYPQERLISIIRTSLLITSVTARESFALLIKAFRELLLSVLLLFVPWITVFGPNCAMRMAGFTVEALDGLMLPEDPDRIFPDGVQ